MDIAVFKRIQPEKDLIAGKLMPVHLVCGYGAFQGLFLGFKLKQTIFRSRSENTRLYGLHNILFGRAQIRELLAQKIQFLAGCIFSLELHRFVSDQVDDRINQDVLLCVGTDQIFQVIFTKILGIAGFFPFSE